MPRISAKNQVTIPVNVLEEAGLHAGDRVVIRTLEDGEVRLTREAEDPFADAFGVLTGTYPTGYLEELDREELDREDDER